MHQSYRESFRTRAANRSLLLTRKRLDSVVRASASVKILQFHPAEHNPVRASQSSGEDCQEEMRCRAVTRLRSREKDRAAIIIANAVVDGLVRLSGLMFIYRVYGSSSFRPSYRAIPRCIASRRVARECQSRKYCEHTRFVNEYEIYGGLSDSIISLFVYSFLEYRHK